jgi:hypothetical protein
MVLGLGVLDIGMVLAFLLSGIRVWGISLLASSLFTAVFTAHELVLHCLYGMRVDVFLPFFLLSFLRLFFRAFCVSTLFFEMPAWLLLC